MAWIEPKWWAVGEMVDGTLLDAQLKGNMDVLGTHGHGSGAGSGSLDLGPLLRVTMASTASPLGGVGRLARIGTHLGYDNGTTVLVTLVNPGGTTSGLLNLDGTPTGGTSGTHTH
jgi:hypothetical protein